MIPRAFITAWKQTAPWFNGTASLTTFKLEELLATKVRALYQRRKGRDLFDLWYADQNATIDWPCVMRTFRQIMEIDPTPVTNKSGSTSKKNWCIPIF